MNPKHAAAYLPHRLQFDIGPDAVAVLLSLDFWHDDSAKTLPMKLPICEYKHIKRSPANAGRATMSEPIEDLTPILKPYADAKQDPALTEREQIFCALLEPDELPHHLFDKLCGLQYDVFGLVEAGEATAYDHAKHNNAYFIGTLEIFYATEAVAHALSHAWLGNITKQDAIEIAMRYWGHGYPEEKQAIAEIVNRDGQDFKQVLEIADEIEKAARAAYDAAYLAKHLKEQEAERLTAAKNTPHP